MQFIDTISSFSFLGFHYWGYVVLFIAAVSEAVPFVGLFVPGMTIVIAGGFMVKLGMLDIGYTIIIVAIGAIFGDLVGYVLGKRYGVSFLEKYGKYFFFHKEHYEKTKQLMNKHTGKSLIIGRFNSLTRAFVPFIAGSTHIPFKKFLIFNIVGGVAWAGSFVILGYVFGQSYEAMSKYVGKFITITIVVGIALVYFYNFINKNKQTFPKYHLYALLTNIFSLFVFTKIIESLVRSGFMLKIDMLISNNIVLLWFYGFNEIMIFASIFFRSFNLILFSAFLFIILLVKKKLYYATVLFTGIVGGVTLDFLIKFLMHRIGPLNSLISVNWYSFPSISMVIATIFFIILIYSFKDEIKSEVIKILFIISNVILLLFVGFSNIYSNVYWFSDVVAGLALGVFWITLLVLVFKFIVDFAHKIPFKISTKFFRIENYDKF